MLIDLINLSELVTIKLLNKINTINQIYLSREQFLETSIQFGSEDTV